MPGIFGFSKAPNSRDRTRTESKPFKNMLPLQSKFGLDRKMGRFPGRSLSRELFQQFTRLHRFWSSSTSTPPCQRVVISHFQVWDSAQDRTMPQLRLLGPATVVHLLCRAAALLFEIAVLIVLIYISATTGYKNGVRYTGVNASFPTTLPNFTPAS